MSAKHGTLAVGIEAAGKYRKETGFAFFHFLLVCFLVSARLLPGPVFTRLSRRRRSRNRPHRRRLCPGPGFPGPFPPAARLSPLFVPVSAGMSLPNLGPLGHRLQGRDDNLLPLVRPFTQPGFVSLFGNHRSGRQHRLPRPVRSRRGVHPAPGENRLRRQKKDARDSMQQHRRTTLDSRRTL